MNGFEALGWANRQKTGSANRKLVLLILASYADEEGSCFPSQKRIAEEAELSERTVRTVLAELEATGLLRRVRRGRQGTRGGRTSDRFYLCFQPAAVAGSFAIQPANLAGSNGDSNGNGLPVSPGDTSSSLRTSFNPAPLAPGGTTQLSSNGSQPNPAREILNEWWERQSPRPQQPYPAALKVLTKALNDGWTPDELRQALDGVSVVSGGALDFWRRKRTNGNRPKSAAALEAALAARAGA